ncbi:SPASM domain-containing protein [uncultured Roseobacter sp.]|uniref:radical SAM protein n=1 Tax=uncultured Roseobacter sp. TaxID=114847 RepID=UPI00260C3425|nr:SPASM domain-containing protein [uncultured Roseobacter sp.]
MKDANDIPVLGHHMQSGHWFDTLSGTIMRDALIRDDLPDPPETLPYKETFPQLQLSLTYACNMECSYCSFRARMNADGRPLNMKKSTALDAVDFFVEEIAGKTRHARIDFGLTGETFLRHKMHADLREKIRARTAPLPLRSVSVGPNTTNGTLSDDIGLEAAMGPPQDISCDGPREVHDAVRPYVDGRGTYDELVPLIDKVLARHPDIGATAVITHRCTDITLVFRHLYDELGFRSIYIKPVNLPPDDPDGLNPETVDDFCRGYTDFVDFLLAAPTEDRLRYLAALNGEDFFMRFFLRVVNRTRNIYRCGAGKSGAYVDTDGNLFPCAHFIGKKGHEIGTVQDGFDEEKRDAYRALTVDSREPCRSCWAKYVCGGGCYYQAVLANGAIDAPDAAKCQLIRHLVSEALRLYEHLAIKAPDTLAALDIPFHLPVERLSVSEHDLYHPAARLRPATGETNLMTRHHLRGALAGQDEALNLRFAQKDGRLDLQFDAAGAGQLDQIEIWVVDLANDPVLMADLPAFSRDVFGRRLFWSGGDQFRLTKPPMDGAFRAVPYAEPAEIPVAAESVRPLGPWAVSLDLPALLDGAEGTIGLNMTCHLKDGRTVDLIRAEPFAVLDGLRDGPLALEAPLWRLPQDRETLNASPYVDMVSLTEWRGLQQNVC